MSATARPRTWPRRLAMIGFALLFMALVGYVLFGLRHLNTADSGPGGPGTLAMDERLQIQDTTLTLGGDARCVDPHLTWQIGGYTDRVYTIKWTVTEVGADWRWHHTTLKAGRRGQLTPPVCDQATAPGRTVFTVTGNVQAVTLDPPASGSAPPATARLVVRRAP